MLTLSFSHVDRKPQLRDRGQLDGGLSKVHGHEPARLAKGEPLLALNVVTEARPRMSAPNATENEMWVNTNSGVYRKPGRNILARPSKENSWPKTMPSQPDFDRKRAGLLMPRNRKLTTHVTGRCVQCATAELGRLVIVFDDRSTMTVKTAGIATTISTGAKVKAVLENGDQCTLQFKDGSSVTVKLADPGASITVRDRCNSVQYLG